MQCREQITKTTPETTYPGDDRVAVEIVAGYRTRTGQARG